MQGERVAGWPFLLRRRYVASGLLDACVQERSLLGARRGLDVSPVKAA